MSKKQFSIVAVLAVSVLCLSLSFICGCESDAQTGALIGTAAGAGVGQAIGRNTTGTVIGAAVGGGAGYMIGNEGDKKKTQTQIESVRAEQNTVTVWITNSNGSKIPVTLRKSGPNYIGPKGETYPNMPTEDQLRPVYGF
jgi:phage tail tape-measure protein